MKCPKCGTEFNANYCPNCGAPAPSSNASQQPVQNPVQQPFAPNPLNQPKKRKGCLIAVIIAVALIVIIAVASILGGNKTGTSGLSSSGPSAAPTANNAATTGAAAKTGPGQAEKTEPYSTELTSGNYTAGIDFPAGTYDITAVEGSGNVYSSNVYSGGINAVMGTANDGISEKEYKNIQMTDGVVLSVSSVKIKISSAAADKAGMKARTNTAAKEVELGAGNFTAGTDFDPGVYNISVVSGNGNVSSSNLYEGGLNAIMGTDSDAMYEKSFNNAEFKSGDVLTISGVKIKLTPSK